MTNRMKEPTENQFNQAIAWLRQTIESPEADPGGVVALNILMKVKRERLDQAPEALPSAPVVSDAFPLVHPEMPLDPFFARSPVGPPMGPPDTSPGGPALTPGRMLDAVHESVTRFQEGVNGSPAPAHAVAALVHDLLNACFTDVSIQAQDISFSPTYCGLIVRWEGGPEFHLDFRAFA